MFEGFKSFFNRVFRLGIAEGTIERAFDVQSATSQEMAENIDLWYAMYTNKPPWATCDVRPLGLPSAIGRELARHAMTEFNVTVSGGERGEYINRMVQIASEKFKQNLEVGLCLGGIALKPYPDGDRILVDATSATAFSPTDFDGTGKAIGGVFRETIKQGREYYTRLEYHKFEWTDSGVRYYFIRNKAFKSGKHGEAGAEVSLDTVPKWAGLQAETILDGIEQPLFSYFKPPISNDVEPESRVGISVYSGPTAELIRRADEQWERIWWEYESGERKIFTDGTVTMASHFTHRLFETGDFTSSGNMFEQFSPEYRDEPLFRGLNRIIQRIEFNVGLSYGTISDPQTVEKTATEVISAKQRQYATEADIQKAFQATINGVIYAMDVYCDLYGLAPRGEYEVAYSWGDGVLDDPETRRQDKAIDLQEVDAGLMNNWEYRMKWFKEDEDTAKKNLPKMNDVVTEPQEEIE